jgi:polyadenylate-binding protein
MAAQMTGATNPGAQPASASLYVGDLAPAVTEALLFEIFNAVGPVASIRVCRDAVSRRSLGYAYVNFHNVMDAERALDTMNFISIRGKPCRIMWSQRDPSLRKSGLGNVFVKNLDKTIDHKTLYDTFSMFGNILSCKVATDDKGESRGYGFVHYTLPESAEKAIAKVNGMVIAEKKVTVAAFVPKEQRTAGTRRYTNVYIQSLPKTWDEAKLREHFESVGPINSIFLPMGDDGTNKGFGFANYPEAENAAAAVEKYNNLEIDGTTLYVTRAMKKAEREKFLKEKWEKAKTERQKKFAGVNLYVKYLDDSIDDEGLKTEFSKFGNITSAKVMRDANGRSRGFGFVCFEKSEQSTIAMAEMNNKIVAGKPLYVALAQRKEVRRATLEKEQQQKRGLGRGGERRDPKNPGGPAGRGPGGPGGRGRGMGRQMKNPMGYGPQNFNPMYGGRGFNPQQMAMYGPGRQAPMQQNWNPSMRQPMMPGGFARTAMPYNNMMGMPQPRAENYANRQATGARPPAGGPARQAPPAASAPAPARQGAPAGGHQPKRDTSIPLTSDMLAQANPSQQKQMIGERIFPKIQHREPKLAGKITGMLLEMDNMELLHLLENEEALMLKINEALAVLNSHSNDVTEAAAE